MTSPVIREVKVDHDNFRDLLERFKDAASRKESGLMHDIVNTMIREASVHSDAEEMSIYKTLAENGMADAAEHDKAEHNDVKQAMYSIDSESVDRVGHDKYVSMVTRAGDLFLKHADEEENDQLVKLVAKLSDDDQVKLARQFLDARKMATTRPHPMAPQSGGAMQKTAEVMSKPLDQAHQAMRKFVDLKYQHSEPGQA
ncbi:uncharacterized protein PFL1_01008 [Pseudozyma flocculosa PF-1]|uniref:Hemerythrin-like domain-containing protein n=1 Tax=Pseudozyma flocculosa TaxID=84751 RepID=A0A5C3F8R6_9BASI|nr:uncharacterized protein PFL1_01008 [Pseudozyma flocculosa PF-1]EPQ31675.1 hypothetical protein PFL1_01008 [Pseudozyma flocculosa PF-1]SPO40792.1 uncharacterized protein PSFLO_06274 [Pseudozyma flocculosa]